MEILMKEVIQVDTEKKGFVPLDETEKIGCFLGIFRLSEL